MAVKLANATNAALDQIELDPGIGSPTLGKLLGIPGLRTWRVAKFPLLWCYFESGDHLDVVRLLDSCYRSLHEFGVLEKKENEFSDFLLLN